MSHTLMWAPASPSTDRMSSMSEPLRTKDAAMKSTFCGTPKSTMSEMSCHSIFNTKGEPKSAGGQSGAAHLIQAQTGTVPSRLEGIAVRSRDVCVFVYLLGEGGQLDDGAGQVHVLALTDHGRVHHLGCGVAQPRTAAVSSGDFSASRPLSALGGR